MISIKTTYIKFLPLLGVATAIATNLLPASSYAMAKKPSLDRNYQVGSMVKIIKTTTEIDSSGQEKRSYLELKPEARIVQYIPGKKVTVEVVKRDIDKGALPPPQNYEDIDNDDVPRTQLVDYPLKASKKVSGKTRTVIEYEIWSIPTQFEKHLEIGDEVFLRKTIPGLVDYSRFTMGPQILLSGIGHIIEVQKETNTLKVKWDVKTAYSEDYTYNEKQVFGPYEIQPKYALDLDTVETFMENIFLPIAEDKEIKIENRYLKNYGMPGIITAFKSGQDISCSLIGVRDLRGPYVKKATLKKIFTIKVPNTTILKEEHYNGPDFSNVTEDFISREPAKDGYGNVIAYHTYNSATSIKNHLRLEHSEMVDGQYAFGQVEIEKEGKVFSAFVDLGFCKLEN